MSRLDREPEVISLARSLQLEPAGKPVQRVLEYCHKRISDILDGRTDITTLATLEDLICKQLSLQIEEVWTDEDLDALAAAYVSAGEPVFAAVRDSLDERTFATLVECLQTHPHGRRYVAVVDCRGVKANRRFFTRWHEIAHILTLTSQIELPFHRSVLKGDPIEQLMDVIAGDIGFYDSIFRPAVESAVRQEGRLTLEIVEEIRLLVCPTASFQATLIACVKHCPTPVVHVSARMGFKAREARLRASGQFSLLPSSEPEPKLRAVTASSNALARALGLRIDQNMEIPDTSVISRLFHSADSPVDDGINNESLLDWKHSDGEPVGDEEVIVEARRWGDSVYALVQPARG